MDEEEIKGVQRLDETRILDSSNVHGLIQQRNTNNLISAAARGGFHEINAPSDDMLPGQDKEL